MLGFVCAVGVELATGKGVSAQLFDSVTQAATRTQTHALDATGVMSFAFVVLATTLGSLAPLAMRTGAGAASEAAEAAAHAAGFGPFTPAAELQNSRAAMLGFAGLLAVEGVKGSALF
jgi:hypothetical protein